MSEEIKHKSDSLSKMSWRRMRKNKLAMFGMIIIVVAAFVSILGANIRPDKSKDADMIIPNIGYMEPGFETTLLKKRKNAPVETSGFFDMMFFGGTDLEHEFYALDEFWFEGAYLKYKEYRNDGKEGALEVVHVANVIYPLESNSRFEPIGKDSVAFYVMGEGRVVRSIKSMVQEAQAENLDQRTYWLGTDGNGRDMLSRLMASTIVSLLVGLMAVFISVSIGITLGAISGYFRGWVDDVIMWLINVIWSIPTLLLVIAVSVALGKGYTVVFIAVGLTMWVEVARIVRGQILSVREKEFVEAGRALGYSPFRIILLHVLPNVMGPVIVIAAANFASAILIEAGLSFLGIGTQPPQPSWGAMLSDYRHYITDEGRAYLPVLPGLCIVILVLAFMLLGNGIRDSIDTKAVDDVPAGGV